ncbi:MAG: FixH family protein [Caldilineales bacterium]|nr:FixH family protein [Caldilineales bacterium]
MRTQKRFQLVLFVLITLAVTLTATAGCGRASNQPETRPDIRVSLTVEPDPPVVGPAILHVRVVDQADKPLTGASISAKADMSHAGMQPVLGESTEAGDGDYTIPIEWTMGGDWFVTLDITLADGSSLSRRFDLSVGGNMKMQGDGS